MSDLELIIGNKTYSSWSMRPWIALRHSGIAFREMLIPFDFEGGNGVIKAASPSGKVPILKDGALTVCDSLAILEYVAERHPEAGLWPADRSVRARARSISAEMHAGFAALRTACPMNMRRAPAAVAPSEALNADVARIVAIWRECLERSGGPFLFGTFTNADAVYAPVVNRFLCYRLAEGDDAVARYSATVTGLEAWKEWEEAARAETWKVPQFEV